MRTPTRRTLLVGASAALATRASPALAQGAPAPGTPRRIVAMDWAAAETLIALGQPPVAIAELPGYRQFVRGAPPPPSVADAGLRLSPNPEAILSLRPDLILINPAQSYLQPLLRQLAPVEDVPIYVNGSPYDLSVAAARHLGAEGRATALETAADAAVAALAAAGRTSGGVRPICAVSPVDRSHVMVFGAHSMIDDVLTRARLSNAWTGAVSRWGTSTVGIEALFALPDATLLHFATSPSSEAAMRELVGSPIWAAIPAVRRGWSQVLPPSWPYGALPSAIRTADALRTALLA